MNLPISILLLTLPTLISSIAHFTNLAGQHSIRAGETATLECRIGGDLEGSLVMWQRVVGGRREPLFVEGMPMGDPGNKHLDYDEATGKWDLVIVDAEPYDDGVYVCEITTDKMQELNHTLVVKVPPTVSMRTRQDPLIVRPGEPLRLSCNAGGNPMPQISWTKADSLMATTLSVGQHFNVQSASTDDSGTYICTATNSEGTAEDTIHVKVQSSNAADDVKPTVRAATSYVPIMLASTVNISCFYEAQPEPTIKWIHNGFPIDFKADSRKIMYQARHSNETEVVLSLIDLEIGDKGTYTCEAGNYMGSDRATVRVDSTPGPPEMDIDEESNGDIRVNVQVESPTEVIEYEVKYHGVHDDETIMLELFRPQTKSSRDVTTNQPAAGVWRAEYTLTKTKPRTEYVIETRAKNSEGWGPWPERSVTYTTPDQPSKRRSNARDARTRTGAGMTIGASIGSMVTMLTVVLLLRR